jgi:hypothetical protein
MSKMASKLVKVCLDINAGASASTHEKNMTAKWFPRPTGYANLSNDVELVLGPKRNWHLSEKVSLGRSSWA